MAKHNRKSFRFIGTRGGSQIPSITIHSLTQEAWDARIIHTSKDRISAMHLDDYYRTYRLVSAYAAYLDRFSIATGERVPRTWSLGSAVTIHSPSYKYNACVFGGKTV
jgi:hypothetical protein